MPELDTPLALLVCQHGAILPPASSSWVCATSAHLDPNLMKQSAYQTQRKPLVWYLKAVALCLRGAAGFLYAHIWIPFIFSSFFDQRRHHFFSELIHTSGCWTPARVTQAWKTAIVIQLSQGVIVEILWLPYQHHMKHLWLAGWHWWPGRNPNFWSRACQILLFQGLVTWKELLITSSQKIKIKMS